MRNILIAAFAVLVSVFSCASCAPGLEAPRSAVTLARLAQPTPEPAWSSSGEPAWTSMRARYVPHCSAFAVKREGLVQLATAAHCVANTDRARYFRTWGMGDAQVAYVSEARDVAFLDVDDSELVPLDLGPLVVGQSVRAYSAVFDTSSVGSVQHEFLGGWFETSQTITFGWSGSPVLDYRGRAVGLVARCLTSENKCMHGHALVASLL
jgi:hypothetical protein